MKTGQKFKVGDIVIAKFYTSDVGKSPSDPRDIGHYDEAAVITEKIKLRITEINRYLFNEHGGDYITYTSVPKVNSLVYDENEGITRKIGHVTFFQKELDFFEQPKVLNWRKQMGGLK